MHVMSRKEGLEGIVGEVEKSVGAEKGVSEGL